MEKNSVIGVSVVVCCYNSALRLPKTIEYLAKQKISDNLKNIEIIIVDNASTDDTALVAKKEWDQYNLKEIAFNVVKEFKPGLSNARMCGVRNAKYEYVLFCDDDNWLSDTYIQTVFDVFNANQNIGAIGGEGVAVSDVPFPAWFDKFKGAYACTKQGESSGMVTDRGYLFGAGLAMRKKIFDVIFAKNYKLLLSGRNGKILTAGEDGELCQIAILCGYDLFYDEKIYYFHFMPKERLTYGYLIKLNEGFGAMSPVFQQYNIVTKNRYQTVRATWIYALLSALYSLLLNNSFEFFRVKFHSNLERLRNVISIRGKYSQNYNKILQLRVCHEGLIED